MSGSPSPERTNISVRKDQSETMDVSRRRWLTGGAAALAGIEGGQPRHVETRHAHLTGCP
jgi:hypothetical protein